MTLPGATRALRGPTAPARDLGNVRRDRELRLVYRSSMRDPVEELVHDHADLNRRVLVLGAAMAAADARVVEAQLADLREQLFLHFAREEEGLFPFVAEVIPELEDQVRDIAIAHDAICGALARMCHAATAKAERSMIAPMYERFERSYADHAATEAALLRTVAGRLDAEQRRRLAAIVRGL